MSGGRTAIFVVIATSVGEVEPHFMQLIKEERFLIFYITQVREEPSEIEV